MYHTVTEPCMGNAILRPYNLCNISRLINGIECFLKIEEYGYIGPVQYYFVMFILHRGHTKI